MSEPEDRKDAPWGEVGHAMLRAAAEDRPPEGASNRALLAIAAVPISTAATVGTASVSASKVNGIMHTMRVGTGKWVATAVFGAAVCGAVGLRLAHVAHDAALSSPTSSAVVTPSMPRVAMSAPVAEAETPPLPGLDVSVSVETLPRAPAPARSPATSSPSPPSASTPASLGAEIAAVDVARRSLANGDAKACLSALGAYERDYPRGAFSEEATALRIEALVLSKDRALASAVAQKFLNAHPTSPHAARIRTLLGTEDP